MSPSEEPSGRFGDSVERLIEEARAGSRDALGALLEGFRGLLLAEARAQLPDELAGKIGASDLVQSTFLEAHQAFAEFRGTSEAELRHWLCSILGNNVQNCIRTFRNTDKRDISKEVLHRDDPSAGGPGEGPTSSALSPSALAIRREEEELLAQALERLDEADRTAIVLHHKEGRQFSEIAKLMQLPSGEAARKRFSRAIERLQGMIENVKAERRTGPPESGGKAADDG